MELGKGTMPDHTGTQWREDRQGSAPLTKKQRLYKCNGGHVPPGWLDCPAYGKLIDCILPSKVAFGQTFNDYVLLGKRYSFQKTYQGRILGLVIDLTNENGYYSVLELNLQNIKHVKIPCKGVNSVPDNESVNLFVNEIRKFVDQQKHSNKYVLVHGTYGHNRTGYMIVHYLMRTRLIISVTQAIKIFANARPPGIYKPEYIDSLYAFYHESKPRTLVCPPKPEWERSAEFDLTADAAAAEDDNGGLGMKMLTISPAGDKKEPMKNDDILGDSIPFDQEYTLRKICYELLKLPVEGKRNIQFPGSHPASLNRENIELLRQQCYYATWNADGERYMMMITSDACYLIDRTFHFRRVQLRFPSVLAKPHHLTLVDGEMIIDRVDGSGQQVRRYLIYDIMAINSISLVERPFCERWEMIDTDVIQPRNQERLHIKESQNPDYRYELEPFRARRKDFWLLSTVPNLLNEFIPKLSHKADGLVFQGWFAQYVPHTNKWLLKWKNAEKNSVDFLYELVDEDHLLYVHDKGKKKFMAANRILFPQDSNPSQYSGKIIECRWNDEKQMWICMQIRSDKSNPNEYSTYLKVTRSIRDNINEDTLVKEIGRIISLPNYAGITAAAKARK